MVKRPISLSILGFFPALLGVLFPLYVSLLLHTSSTQWKTFHLPTIAITTVAALMIAPFVLDAQRWALLLLPVLVTSIGGISLYSVEPGLPPERWALYWGVVGALAGATIIGDVRVLQLIFEPSLRWWKRPPRHTYTTPVTLTAISGVTCPSESLNLSESGILVRLRSPHPNGAFETGQIVTIDWTWQNERLLLPGTIARRNFTVKNDRAFDLGISFLTRNETLADLVDYLATTQDPAFREQQKQT